MATTSLKLPDELKARAQAIAEQKGLSPHAFMVDAIEKATTRSELRARFVADALAAETYMEKTGFVYAAEDMQAYIRAKNRGEKPAAPKPIPWEK
jgi:predicted transcriptional regulator